MPYAYRKSERLKKNADFVSTMKGKRLSVDGLSLFYQENGQGNFRIGITVSKRLVNAAKRNQLKRRIRNCLIKTIGNKTRSYDMVFVARKEIVEADYSTLLRTVDKLLIRSVLCKQTTDGAST